MTRTQDRDEAGWRVLFCWFSRRAFSIQMTTSVLIDKRRCALRDVNLRLLLKSPNRLHAHSHAQMRVGLSALKIVLKAFVGARMRLSVLGNLVEALEIS